MLCFCETGCLAAGQASQRQQGTKELGRDGEYDLAPSPRVLVERYLSGEGTSAERHAAWVSRPNSPIGRFFETVPTQPFHIDTELVALGPVLMCHTDITAQDWRRDATRLAQHPLEAICLHINISGTSWGRMGGRKFVQPPGWGMVADLAQVSSHSSGGGRNLTFLIAHDHVRREGIDPALIHGLLLNTPETALLTAHALQLRETLPFLAGDDAELIGKTLLGLIVLAVRCAQRDGVESSRPMALLALRAKQDIRANLGSSTLNASSLAKRLGVSRSTLHRAFADEGGVQPYIRLSRLDAARQALLNPHSLEPIGEIANRLGFADSAHLSRLFRAQFGEAPSKFRARSLIQD